MKRKIRYNPPYRKIKPCILRKWKAVRQYLQMPLKYMAYLLDVEYSSLVRWERGKNAPPVSVYSKYCKILSDSFSDKAKVHNPASTWQEKIRWKLTMKDIRQSELARVIGVSKGVLSRVLTLQTYPNSWVTEEVCKKGIKQILASRKESARKDKGDNEVQ